MRKFSFVFRFSTDEFPAFSALWRMLRKSMPPLMATLHFLMGCSGSAPAYAAEKPQLQETPKQEAQPPESHPSEPQIALNGHETAIKHFRRGIYAGAEVSAGLCFSGKDEAFFSGRRTGHSDYAFALWGGYRALPQFAIALGFEGSNSVSTGTTSVPIFLRIRSDFLDRRVSPFVQIDAGYAFQFAPSRQGAEDLKLNREPFPEKFRGFASAEEYLNAHIADYLNQFAGLPQDELDRIAAEERSREWQRLCNFPNGKRHYLPREAFDSYGSFSKDGFFGCVTIGAGFGVGKEQGRVSLGISAGLAQYSGTVSLRTRSGKFLGFSVPAHLPDGTPVLTERTSLADNRLRAELRIRLSYDF